MHRLSAKMVAPPAFSNLPSLLLQVESDICSQSALLLMCRGPLYEGPHQLLIPSCKNTTCRQLPIHIIPPPPFILSPRNHCSAVHGQTGHPFKLTFKQLFHWGLCVSMELLHHKSTSRIIVRPSDAKPRQVQLPNLSLLSNIGELAVCGHLP